MPNLNFEENLKTAIGTVMFQNIQFQTMINQLSERVSALEIEVKAAAGPKLAVDNIAKWPTQTQRELPFEPV